MKGFRLAWMVTLVAAMLFLCGSALAQSTDALVVDENGNVGIGTAWPGAKLDIRSTGTAAQIFMGGPAQSNHSGIKFQTDSDSNQWIFSAGSGYYMYGGPGSLNLCSGNGLISLSSTILPNMLAVNAGNVGIGTAWPGAKLDIRSSGTAAQIFMGGPAQSDHSGIKFQTDSDTNQWIFSAGSGYYMYGGPGSLNLFANNGIISLSNQNHPNALVVSASNTGIGTKQFGNNAAKVLGLGNGTAPTSSPPDMIQLYAVDHVDGDGTATSELFVRDEDGSSTNLSPHIFALFQPDAVEPFPWSYYAENSYLGKMINVDMAGAIRAIERLTGKKFIFYKDMPKADIQKENREEWKKEWIAKNTTEQEVSKDEALEAVEVMVDDTTKVASEKVTYALEGRNVVEVRTPVYATRTEQKWQLRNGARLDTNTGRFFMKKEPTEADAEAAASTQFQLVVRKWIRDRM